MAECQKLVDPTAYKIDKEGHVRCRRRHPNGAKCGLAFLLLSSTTIENGVLISEITGSCPLCDYSDKRGILRIFEIPLRRRKETSDALQSK